MKFRHQFISVIKHKVYKNVDECKDVCKKLIRVLNFRFFFFVLDYSDIKVLRILNSELADTLGNLLSRACAKSLNPRQVFPRLHPDQLNELLKEDCTKRLINALKELPGKCPNLRPSTGFLHSQNNLI